MLLEKAFSHYKFFEHYTTKKKYREANIMAKCCKNFTIEFKKKGDIIFKERDYADRMYFVLKGKIKVYQNKTFLEVTENREKFRQAQLAAQIQAAQMAAQLAAEKPETIILTRGVSMAEVPSDIKEMSPQKKPVGSVYHYERSLDPDIPFVTDSKYNVFFDEGVLTIKPIGWIAEGEVFGELALTNRKPRTASLIATEDTILGVFQKKHYDEILFDLENDRITKMMEFFNGSFGVQFNREEVSKMTSIFTKRKTTINGYFFKNGEKADGFYILKKGEVAVKYFEPLNN